MECLESRTSQISSSDEASSVIALFRLDGMCGGDRTA